MNVFDCGGTYSCTLAEFQGDLEVRRAIGRPGAYTLNSRDRMLYAGSSQVNMAVRISRHCQGRSTSYLYRRLLSAKRCRETIVIHLYPLESERVRHKEMELIQRHEPLYNSKLPSVAVL